LIRFALYSHEHFEDLHRLIAEADRVDGAGLGMTREELRHLVDGMGDKPENMNLAFVNERPVGYVRLGPRKRNGRLEIGCFGVVHPSYRRRGIGRALLEWAMTRARETAAGKPCRFYVPVRHSVEGLKELVESLGMKPAHSFRVLRYDSGASCAKERGSAAGEPPAGPPGFVIRTFGSGGGTTAGDARAYSAALNTIFDRGCTTEEILSITREPGFDPNLWLLAFVKEGTRKGDLLLPEGESALAGFCTCDVTYDQAPHEGLDPAQPSGEIAFLGVLPEHRGKGLGLTLLRLAVGALLRKGCDNIHLAVSTDNERAVDLYRRAGFVEWRRSTTYSLTF
jgi:mycothiol synthase